MTASRLQIVSALAVLAAATAGLYTARAAEPASPMAPATVSAHFLSVLPSSHAAFFAQAAAQTQTSGQAVSGQPAKSNDPLPPGKGHDITEQTCSGCHAVTMFSTQRHTRDQWWDIISTMLNNGLSASDQDLATILNYLSTNLAPAKNSTTPPATPPTNPPATPPATPPQQ